VAAHQQEPQLRILDYFVSKQVSPCCRMLTSQGLRPRTASQEVDDTVASDLV
jgi:hypothetical protein